MKTFLTTLPASVRASLTIILIIIMIFAFNAGRSQFGTQDAPLRDTNDAFFVIVTRVIPQQTGDTVTINGITAATKTVIVKAETPGQVADNPATEGQLVKANDVLCRLAIDSRKASTAEARAALQKAEMDYEAALNLSEQGFQSSAAVANAKAALDRAKAGLNRSSLDLKKTTITSPFAGILTQYFVDKGDFLAIGSPCAEVKQLDPIKVVATVSEKDVKRLIPGSRAILEVDDEALEATVSFVAKAANPSTRTFTIELKAANTPGWRDGETALAVVTTGNQMAYRIPRNALVLNDEGLLGIRTITPSTLSTSNARVSFLPVEIIKDDDGGAYIIGPQNELHIITRGQNYVRHGQNVIVADSNLAADGAQSEN